MHSEGVEIIVNYLFISPHFPKIFENFAIHLNNKGVRVLGVADEPYDNLSHELKGALTEYYKVDNLENYDEVIRACGYFTHKYGKIDRVESHNEYWLPLDAQIRTDFNVFGYKNKDMEVIRKKSGMKEIFKSKDIPVAKGRVFEDEKDAKKLAKKLGFPVIIKPDAGVGASDTYKIKNTKDLDEFLAIQSEGVDYIMEEFIEANIVTYDGLTDIQGNIVFDQVMIHDKPILEVATDNTDMYYYMPREIDEDLRKYGKKCIEAFNIRERFFHLEFFRTDDGDLVALELNCRIPGGNTPEMWNYANDFDIYKEYANVVVDHEFKADISRKYFTCYTSRKDFRNYKYSNEEIIEKYSHEIVNAESIPGVFAQVLGDIGFIFRTETKEQMDKIIEDIWKEG